MSISETRMFVFLGFCVLFAVIWSAVPVMSKSSVGEKSDHKSSYVTEYVADERHKRAIASLVALLLGKSKLIFQYGKYRQFNRYGGYEQALKDFDDLKPKNVQDFKNSIHGQIGNTEVILYKHRRTVMTLLTEKPLPGGQSFTMEVDAIRYLD